MPEVAAAGTLELAGGSERARRWLIEAPRFSALFAMAVASLTLLGWLVGIDALIRVVPISGAGVMMPITAVCFLLSGAALLLLRSESQLNRRRRAAGMLLALSVAFVGLLVISEWSLGVDLGVRRII